MRPVLGDRIAVTRRTALLAAGDALAIAVFVAAGELRHAGTFAAGVETFVQFAVGWAAVAVPIGAYATDALRSPRRAGALALAGWGLGALVAQAIRAAVRPGFHVAPSFVLVSVGVGGALLLAWRLVAAARWA